jgi:hypothetical protein
MRHYDEDQEIMRYVWRNYPDLLKPHQCVASTEQVCTELQPELRDEYRGHMLECRRVAQEAAENDKAASGEGYSQTSMPLLPELSSEFTALLVGIYQKLEKENFRRLLEPLQAQFKFYRCPCCQKILINERTRQCYYCGHDCH